MTDRKVASTEELEKIIKMFSPEDIKEAMLTFVRAGVTQPQYFTFMEVLDCAFTTRKSIAQMKDVEPDEPPF